MKKISQLLSVVSMGSAEQTVSSAIKWTTKPPTFSEVGAIDYNRLPQHVQEAINQLDILGQEVLWGDDVQGIPLAKLDPMAYFEGYDQNHVAEEGGDIPQVFLFMPGSEATYFLISREGFAYCRYVAKLLNYHPGDFAPLPPSETTAAMSYGSDEMWPESFAPQGGPETHESNDTFDLELLNQALEHYCAITYPPHILERRWKLLSKAQQLRVTRLYQYAMKPIAEEERGDLLEQIDSIIARTAEKHNDPWR